MIIILGAISVIFAILSLTLFFRYSNLRTLRNFEAQDIEKLEQENIWLTEERIELLKKVESLTTSLKMKEEVHEESLKNSKSVLYDLSHSISNQLIEIHKKEVGEARKQSEERIVKSTESFNNELQKVASLVGALNKDVESSKSIVDNLKNALLSPSSTGMLAEVTLENLLKNSGLKKDIDYSMQHSFEGDEKNRLRPDVVIFLPEDSVLVVDAKSSQFLMNSDDDAELAKSMNNHLKNLINKEYTQELERSMSRKKQNFRRVSSVMFLPTEQALERLAKADISFMQKAWNSNIYPVGPAGLMNILSIARMHIGEKMRIDNYEKIINEINSLISSISIISEHAFKLGNSVSSVVNNYDKFAASFNRNLVSKVGNLKNLGTGNNSKNTKLLERYQLVTSKNDIIEVEESADEDETIKLKNID
jgi:DNA recombination protein RmuC